MSVILTSGKHGNYYRSEENTSDYLTQSQKETNALYIYKSLASEGWSFNAICGILGNMEKESTLNPSIWQSHKVGSTTLGYGLVQWTPSTKFTEWCTDNDLNCLLMDSNISRIIYEVENKVQWIAKSPYDFSFETFSKSSESIETLARAFMICYERPSDQSEEAQLERVENALEWAEYLETYSEDTSEDYTTEIESAIEWAVGIANDDTHGYDQENRWGLDYDCSSLVIQAYEQAGVKVKTAGATYTGNMEEIFVTVGFSSIAYSDDLELIKGDVLLRSGHCAMYIGNGQIVSAHINELGEVVGGQTGDQTGHEIDVSNFSTSGSWLTVLRLPSGNGSDEPIPQPPTQADVNIWRNNFNFLIMNKRRRKTWISKNYKI